MEPNISVLASIFIGVVSGVITSGLIWVAIKLFQNTILPWYQSVVYRGQRISGDWEGFALFPREKDGKDKVVVEEKSSSIHLEQKGHNISGTLILIKQPSGEKEDKLFKLTGFFYDNSLVLTYEVEDKTRFGLGACVFKLVEDGKKLDGCWASISSNVPHRVFSSTEYWKRKE